MRIFSPLAGGNGASIIHKALEQHIQGYQCVCYHPYLTLFPPLLYFLGRYRRYDLIHTVADYGIFHYRKSVPLVLTFHGYVLDSYMREFSSSLQLLHYRTNLKWQTERALPLASRITAVSQYMADLVSRELQPEKPVEVIYNGVDTAMFEPAAGGKERRSDKLVRVLIGGHLSAKKGERWIKDIVEGLDENITLSYTTGINDQGSKPVHARLRCLGHVSYRDMPALYRQHDILLFPTVREGFGLVAAEAMACGLPVVATDCAALPELVSDGVGGYLCPLGDSTGFSSRINRLAEDPALRARMGEYNRQRIVDRFTMERMVRQYEELFAEVAG
jgi:glycosyltransferase involved in cell wall biosynthesis